MRDFKVLLKLETDCVPTVTFSLSKGCYDVTANHEFCFNGLIKSIQGRHLLVPLHVNFTPFCEDFF